MSTACRPAICGTRRADRGSSTHGPPICCPPDHPVAPLTLLWPNSPEPCKWWLLVLASARPCQAATRASLGVSSRPVRGDGAGVATWLFRRSRTPCWMALALPCGAPQHSFVRPTSPSPLRLGAAVLCRLQRGRRLFQAMRAVRYRCPRSCCNIIRALSPQQGARHSSASSPISPVISLHSSSPHSLSFSPMTCVRPRFAQADAKVSVIWAHVILMLTF